MMYLFHRLVQWFGLSADHVLSFFAGYTARAPLNSISLYQSMRFDFICLDLLGNMQCQIVFTIMYHST